MEQNAAQYPINQQIVAGEPAVSQDRQVTDIQWSYVEHDGLNFTQSETNWQFDCITDNGISGSIEKLEWNWGNAESSELLSGDEGSVNKTVCETGVDQCCNGNGRY